MSTSCSFLIADQAVVQTILVHYALAVRHVELCSAYLCNSSHVRSKSIKAIELISSMLSMGSRQWQKSRTRDATIVVSKARIRICWDTNSSHLAVLLETHCVISCFGRDCMAHRMFPGKPQQLRLELIR